MKIFVKSLMLDLHKIAFGVLKTIWINFFFRNSFCISSKISKSKSVSYVVGNGPSLKDDVKMLTSLPSDSTIYTVNFFCLSKMFFVIKPNRYVILDKKFWIDDVREGFVQKRTDVIETLNTVDWPLVLLVPKEGVKFYQKMIESNYVSVEPLVLPCAPSLSPSTYKTFLALGIFAPYTVNVLVTALWIALHETRDNIILLGADADGFKNLNINQSNNQISTGNSYYSGLTQNNPAFFGKAGANPSQKPISIRLLQHYLCFLSFEAIQLRAQRVRCVIVNASSKSYIDCFDRSR